MNTDVDFENKLVQLAVEELVRAGLRTPLREPILAAVESTPDDPVEVVVPEGAGETGVEGTDATGSHVSTDAGSESGPESEPTERGTVGKAARGLVVSAVTFTVLYLALRRLSD